MMLILRLMKAIMLHYIFNLAIPIIFRIFADIQ